MLGETPSSCAVKGVPVECAPLVEFITKREHGFSPEQMAHRRTGRNIRTGKLHLGVSLRRRNNGMVRIEADFWRLPCDLNARAIERFESRWRLLNEATPAKVQARMQRHFSRTALQFDTMAEQADDWQDLLATVLSEPSSYVGID